jgi:hypothetical protein
MKADGLMYRLRTSRVRRWFLQARIRLTCRTRGHRLTSRPSFDIIETRCRCGRFYRMDANPEWSTGSEE